MPNSTSGFHLAAGKTLTRTTVKCLQISNFLVGSNSVILRMSLPPCAWRWCVAHKPYKISPDAFYTVFEPLCLSYHVNSVSSNIAHADLPSPPIMRCVSLSYGVSRRDPCMQIVPLFNAQYLPIFGSTQSFYRAVSSLRLYYLSGDQGGPTTRRRFAPRRPPPESQNGESHSFQRQRGVPIHKTVGFGEFEISSGLIFVVPD